MKVARRGGKLMRSMAVGEFKAKCLAVLKEVDATGQPLLVTKRGKPLARILPPEEPTGKEAPEAIFGCLRGFLKGDLGDLVDPIVPPEDWDHLNEHWSLNPPE
jgi:prevent-host-death family protein